MIYYDKVTKIYPDGLKALDEVSFGVEPKEFVTIVGQSGAGKTTLMKMLIAEDRPTSGMVFFESANIHELRKHDMTRYRRRVGMVFQDYRLIPTKTAYENIAFAMEALAVTPEKSLLTCRMFSNWSIWPKRCGISHISFRVVNANVWPLLALSSISRISSLPMNRRETLIQKIRMTLFESCKK